jgi:small subunit ribosomal protein S20
MSTRSAFQETHVANIKSAQKKHRQMIYTRARNRSVMSNLRTAVKAARSAIDTKAEDAAVTVKAAVSTINKAVSKGVLKKETAARYVSRISTRVAPTA